LRLIPTELPYEEDEILRKLRAGEKIEHYETTRVGKSGEVPDVSVTSSPVRNDADEIIGASKWLSQIGATDEWPVVSSRQANKLGSFAELAVCQSCSVPVFDLP
jgi:hypothetical protein